VDGFVNAMRTQTDIGPATVVVALTVGFSGGGRRDCCVTNLCDSTSHRPRVSAPVVANRAGDARRAAGTPGQLFQERLTRIVDEPLGTEQTTSPVPGSRI
jgi:hypothetical protein